jgi:prepilin-type N-terminal cleavage/methylation domain-containing protein
MMNDRSGWTMTEIMVVVLIIGLLAAIALPGFIKARNLSQQNACINNLRMIDSAKAQWALNARKSDGEAPVTTEVNQYVKGSTTPVCPAGGIYSFNNVGSDPTCAGVTATMHYLPPRILN